MLKKLVAAIFAFYFSACTIAIPTWTYHAPFNPDETEEVIVIMKDIADKWDLQYTVDTGEDMRFLTHGIEAFQMFILFKGESIAVIGNTGFGTVLSLMVADNGDMPIEDLNRLKADIINTLNKRLGIKFELYEKPKQSE